MAGCLVRQVLPFKEITPVIADLDIFNAGGLQPSNFKVSYMHARMELLMKKLRVLFLDPLSG